MDSLFDMIQKVGKVMNYIGGAALTFMMFLTVADVLLRAGGKPLTGVYEIVGLSLALVIGFALPKASLDRAHVFMEFFLEKASNKNKAIINTSTRVLCILLFVIIGYNLFSVGNEFRLSGEVTQTIRLPFFPIAYVVGVCCFLDCFVFLFDIVNIWVGKHE